MDVDKLCPAIVVGLLIMDEHGGRAIVSKSVSSGYLSSLFNKFCCWLGSCEHFFFACFCGVE